MLSMIEFQAYGVLTPISSLVSPCFSTNPAWVDDGSLYKEKNRIKLERKNSKSFKKTEFEVFALYPSDQKKKVNI